MADENNNIPENNRGAESREEQKSDLVVGIPEKNGGTKPRGFSSKKHIIFIKKLRKQLRLYVH